MSIRCALLILTVAACSAPQLSPTVAIDSGIPLRPPLVDLGVAPPSDELRGLFSFKLRDRDALDAAITAMYTPTSPTFRAYMSVEQFMELHGPLEDDVQVVRQFLIDSGLTVARIADNRMLLQITGTVAEFNAAFGVELHKFVKPDDDDYFQYGTDSELILVRDIAERIGAILVLDPAAETSPLPMETGRSRSTRLRI